MATGLAPFFNSQFFTDSGAVAAGYYLYSYLAGTTTPQATKTDQSGTTNNANPIILDSAGRCNLWLTDTAEYAFELWSPPGNPGGALVKRWDDVGAIPAAATATYVPLAGGVTMTGRFNLSATAVSALQPVPLSQLTSAIATAVAPLATTAALTAAGVPIGSIAMWLQGSLPSGWLALEGGTISRTTYAALFSLWGTTYGAGDGSSTFGLPDFRGYFTRGWDNGRGIDAARTLGSNQAATLKAHKHASGWGEAGIGPFGATTGTGYMGSNSTDVDNYMWATNDGTAFDGITNGSDIGTETRPLNIAVRYIVRAV